ncbi:5'-nucleotidase C-terminal domain-containing protein [Nocardioides hwasunensis]|uniref:5'-nucleotidase C-terminal domain-containing protein n=1 Tax=Nocardioides hwasunensis TaxID=397258 RepID=A0ABR8MM73_9ACTN|nr:5'-nucleotidase C-terminal domain-containing protein [Nocardioides hwasunensis]MBD3917123.1 5'-nucleotidase C-terminal domain-containing protein [Nocardioides hwasunensis]
MPSPSASRHAVRAISSATALGVSAAGLVVAAAPSAYAAPVTIQLLNINDFHGRIDANTTKFATTVENLRAANPRTLLLSAGDNIGASLFASSIQQDAPTIDVLNALGLRGSAVGNHELDKGADDLTGRVDDRADFDYLGANVYDKGTTNPALPEYATYQVGGVTVGVIGVVTQETTEAVSPAGIASLDFGDPVDAVNRVAGRLSDGDATNGEADVIVAEYHEGADTNLATQAACDTAIAADTVFGDIATDTAASVDVIFTGHTHSTYACDGPVPGSARTRPIVQTGSYGANIGRVELTVDTTTGAVTAYAKSNVARVASENLSLPRVAQVKSIVDAAIARSVEVGNVAVGTQTGDITTAFTGGSYTGPGGTYTGGTRDDRASESTLGNLVAESMRAGVTGRTADLAVVNPGGLRAELPVAGNTSTYSANTDGVITLAEAAAVLPFANTISLVDLTGAQLDAVLEQQWPTANRTTTLRLGLSDNVRVTADPSRPAGDRVTSIRIDGAPVDPTATYTVSTLNFLAAGGDGFSAFAGGRSTDIGLLDLDLFTDQLKTSSPVSPDFARHQVDVSGTLPETVVAGDRVDVSLSRLDLTSQGSPANASVLAFAVDGDGYRQLGTFPVSLGKADVSLTVPADLAGEQQLALVAEPSRTLVGADLPQLTSTTTAAIPTQVTFGSASTVSVTVDAPLAPRGPARLLDGNAVVGHADVIDGSATFSLTGGELAVGTHQLRVAYDGDDLVAPSASAVTPVRVVEAPVTAPTPTVPTPTTPTPGPVVGPEAPQLSLRVRVKPRPVLTKQTRARVRITLRTADGRRVDTDGRVRVRVGGRTYRTTLRDGRAVVRLRAFNRPGKRWVRVSYRDADLPKRITETAVIRVRAPR